MDIYLDYAATTPVRAEVLEIMYPYWSEVFANPSSVHIPGTKAAQALWGARQQVATMLGAHPAEIIFTSGGTESANLAIYGVARAQSKVGKRHIVTTEIEHHAVLHPIRRLAEEGWEVSYLPVDSMGRVDPIELQAVLRSDTALVSIIMANNEIGTIQDISVLGKLCQDVGIPFHTDACQAAAYVPLDVTKLHVDLMTLNAGKIYGPKGVGVLYVKRGTPYASVILGGKQEMDRRAGTENIPGIVGFAAALRLAREEREVEAQRLKDLRDQLWQQLSQLYPDARRNGDTQHALPHILNVSFPGADGDGLVIYLSQLGVHVSTGSACDTENQGASHVLRAIDVPSTHIFGTLRFSFGKGTAAADIPIIIAALRTALDKVS